MPLIRFAVVALLAVTLSACATRRPAEAPPADTAPPADAGVAQGTPNDAAAATPLPAAPTQPGPQGELLSRRIVYFDFDRAEIRAEDAPLVAAHAAWLAKNPQSRVRLEGHTDERGTREYNIGLGERRAQAVRRALLLQGSAEGQVATVSFGEERPAAAGDEESAFAQNRRVELVYLN